MSATVECLKPQDRAVISIKSVPTNLELYNSVQLQLKTSEKYSDYF